jgi:hypothetical protein
MPGLRWLSILILSMMLISCSKSHIRIDGMDERSWKDDKKGCLGKRAVLVDTLLSQKDKLLALNELDMVDVLGKPDREELYKRNQKFYYYYVHPSKDCNEASPHSLQLVVRFNAMGLAKEINTEE